MNKALTLYPKTTATVAAANISLIVVWIVGHWVEVPVEVGVAFAGLLGFVLSYLAPHAPKV